jgi:hypothetical protein
MCPIQLQADLIFSDFPDGMQSITTVPFLWLTGLVPLLFEVIDLWRITNLNKYLATNVLDRIVMASSYAVHQILALFYKVYDIVLTLCTSVYIPLNNFWSNLRTFVKIRTNIMPLEVTPSFGFQFPTLNNTNMAAVWTFEVGVTLESSKVLCSNIYSKNTKVLLMCPFCRTWSITAV